MFSYLRRWRRLLAAVVLLTSVALPLVPARAAALMTIKGRVVDPVGNPIAGIDVSDGVTTARTDYSGRYVLETYQPRDQVVRARSRWGITTDGEAEVAFVPGATVPLDFERRWAESSLIWEDRLDVVATADGQASTRTLWIFSHSPRPTTPGGAGTCIDVIDPVAGGTLHPPVTRVGGPGYIDGRYEYGPGSNQWTYVQQIPAGMPSSVHDVRVRVYDCQTGTVTTVEPELVATERFDGTRPDQPTLDPVAGTQPRYVQLTGTLTDPEGPIGGHENDEGGCSNYGHAVTALFDGTVRGDGCAIEQPDGTARFTLYAIGGLATGHHRVEVWAKDRAGNLSATPATLELDVDGDPPVVYRGSGRPQGTAATRTPRLAIYVTDASANLDLSTARFTVTGKTLLSTTTATVVPSFLDGWLYWQVPATRTGEGPANGPLPDGTYTVTAEVRDAVGNLGTATWTFQVKGPPVPPVVG